MYCRLELYIGQDINQEFAPIGFSDSFALLHNAIFLLYRLGKINKLYDLHFIYLSAGLFAR
ncbi:MAG: hypothetical protein JETT_1637 [Candidatus Jettenia ecosi]|uniref:Uncharacterized protein n=1 Tax=Candidatus Jettenia ecosi TaxID=2494326 RepID=A0A533QCA5_9BACT|nr:MAG: hypothetical protein JETT_1637 [Candidatus Jettenia ecosi]